MAWENDDRPVPERERAFFEKMDNTEPISNKTVSIIIPVYRLAFCIRETLECVRRQTYADWELILVDDRSDDDSAQIIRAYMDSHRFLRIRLITMEQNGGPALARNRGVQEAKGRYIAFLDGDDLWDRDKLFRTLTFLKNRRAGFVFTGYEFADENGKGLGKMVHVPERLNYYDALKNTTIFTSTVMFDTTVISKDRLEMPVMKSEDTALWWRLLREGEIAYGLDEILVRYRRPGKSGKSLSSNKLEAVRRIWNLYRKAEHLGVLTSAYYFLYWGANAVRRRM